MRFSEAEVKGALGGGKRGRSGGAIWEGPQLLEYPLIEDRGPESGWETAWAGL